MSTDYKPSLHVAINNELVTKIGALECPSLVTSGRFFPSGATSGFVTLAEDQVTLTCKPASVIASCTGETWEASKGCGSIAKRRSSRWEVLVVFDRQVLTDRALELFMQPPTSQPPALAGCTIRLTAVDYTYRPQNTPEQGTALRLTIEVLSNN